MARALVPRTRIGAAVLTGAAVTVTMAGVVGAAAAASTPATINGCYKISGAPHALFVDTGSGTSCPKGFHNPNGIAFDGNHIWITNFNNTVTELNASDGSVVTTLSAPGYGFNDPRTILFDGSHLWVTDSNGLAVTEINP